MRRLRDATRRVSKNCAIFAVFIALFPLLSVQNLHAQANAGIVGTVADASGAVVPDAKVTITNQGTGVENHATTSSAGTYAVTGLTPGVYSITVEASGFKKDVQNSVNVDVANTSTRNVTLSTGSTAETVEVTASAIALNTTSPQLGSTIEPTVVKALPAEVSGRGRQIDSLQFMVPGTTGSAFSHRISGGVDFEQEIVYNGVPAPQPETEGYTTNFNPPYEMVQEFRVERTTFAAQFGLGQGALSYQMASGTNKYHGDLFEINRNSFFDSVGFFNGPSWGGSNTPPTDHENNYGFTVGGPISIPKLYDGRNRTFGHYSQEWYKQNNLNTNSSTVPTALEKTGDFSDFVGSDGTLIPIYDNIPGTAEYGQQFSYNGKANVIPPSMLSPNSQSLLQYLPDPNLPGLDSNRSYAPFVNPHIQNVWGFTVDQVLTPKQGIHYSQWRNSFSNYSFDNNPFVIAPNPLNSMKYEPAKGSGFLLTYDNTITPNLVATAGIAWIGEINNQFNQTRYSFPAIEQGIIPPYITWDGNHSLTDWGTQGSWLQSINRKLGIAIVNNYLWTKGRNTFNIGGEFRRSYQDDNEDQTQGGQFAFSQRQTSSPSDSSSGGSAFASYMLGYPDQVNRSNSQELRLRNFDLSPYVQDDIKFNRRLTINVGLRWDIQVPFSEVNDRVIFLNSDNKTPNPFAGNVPGIAQQLGTCNGCAGYNRADIHWGHVGPRLGFAYQVSDKTVVQAGFAVAFLNGGAYEYGTNKVAVNYGNLLVGSYSQLKTGSQQSSFGSWDVNTMPNPQPTPYSPGLGIGTQINSLNKTKDGFAPYAQQWNVNLQHQAPWNIFVTAAWVGNRVIHLPSKLNPINQFDPKYLALGNDLLLNFADGSAQSKGYQLPYPTFVNDFGASATVAQSLAPFPQYSNVQNTLEGSGTTYYEGLQFEAEKRFTNGLSFLAGWTLSRLWDNTSSGFTSFTAGAINKYNQRPEWGVSTSDEPNTVKVSGTYELPIGPGKEYFNNKGVTGQLLGGWQLSWILDYESGTANGPGENGTPFPPNGGNRPDRNKSVQLSTASYQDVKNQFEGKGGTAQVWQANSFTPTSQFVLGNATRTYTEMRNPAFYNENANIRKHFFLGERFQAILQFDYFNLFNRTQLNGPDTNASNSTFGQVTNKNAANSPANRQGQISVRIEF
ncbi:TonB-dependent receptor [Acidobacterium sp. S8]|uniref:TonB-dependent receptor n=1 Tax=Acidobacterium sp. S8 TaxID=1641854 RepID=UPI00131ADF3D|nr:TonB-dependent receptor [Acidobacterium sp. S8]